VQDVTLTAKCDGSRVLGHPGYVFKFLQDCERPMRLFLRMNRPAFRLVTANRKMSARLRLVAVLLFTFTAALASAQQYTKIVVFGDSLSDTGNVADLTQAKYGIRVPGPVADYTDGRFTDGMDTVPAAHNYFGVWIEQLAASLPSKPVIKSSLDGGTDYAYGFATTGSGTGVFTFGPSDSLSVVVNNIGQQITDYLATSPKIDDKTLFVVWGGAIDILNATSTKDVIDAGVNQAANVERLIAAGATQFIIPNLPPLGAVPRLNGSPATSIPATKASALYNGVLALGIGIVRDLNPGKNLKLVQFDVYSLFNQVIFSPAKFGLVDVTSSSQGIFTVNPDTFLFWDDLHPTTRGHNILAGTAASLIVPCKGWACESSELVAAGGQK
jgi:outer membrane lipase/esterase